MANSDYYIVDPGLAQPQYALSDDTQARILAYVLHQLGKIALLPHGIGVKLIPVQYLGRPYPALGLYRKADAPGSAQLSDAALTQFSFALEEVLQDHIQKTGVQRLAVLSAYEQPHWQDAAEAVRQPVPPLG